MADQISDAVLDALLEQDPTARVACETLLTTGLVMVAGEITTTAYVEIPKIVREVVSEIGYTELRHRLRRAHLRGDRLHRRRSRPTSPRASTPPSRCGPVRAARTSCSPRAPATRG